MKSLLLCSCFLVFGILATTAYPPNNNYYGRLRRTPYQHRAMMYTGYYGNPYRRSAYTPEMTALAAGDTVATNQFGVDQFQPQEPVGLDIPIEENIVKDVPLDEQTDIGLRPVETPTEPIDLEQITTTVRPRRIPKRKPQKPVQPEEDDGEEDDEGFNPFASRRGQGSNVFFPIVFRGYSGARSRNAEEGGYPGSATAIANSFSTGKGGVASSHATAYGDPYAGMYLRGANGKRKSHQQD